MEISLPQSPHFRNIVALILGLTVSAIVVGSVEMLGHAVYPPPAEIDLGNPEELTRLMAQAPVGALLFVIAGWGLGILTGCLLTGILAGEDGTFCCLMLGLIFASMVILMLTQIPSPLWFNIGGLAILIPGGLAGWGLSYRLHKHWQSLHVPPSE